MVPDFFIRLIKIIPHAPWLTPRNPLTEIVRQCARTPTNGAQITTPFAITTDRNLYEINKFVITLNTITHGTGLAEHQVVYNKATVAKLIRCGH